MVRTGPFLLAMTVLLYAAPSFACPVLKKASPPVGSVVTGAPAQIVLRFTGPVDAASSTMQVLDKTGHDMTAGPVESQSDDVVAIGLKSLPPGPYKVIWHLLCHCEGGDSMMPGDYSFTVGPD